jgi:hypothetical protein
MAPEITTAKYAPQRHLELHPQQHEEQCRSQREGKRANHPPTDQEVRRRWHGLRGFNGVISEVRLIAFRLKEEIGGSAHRKLRFQAVEIIEWRNQCALLIAIHSAVSLRIGGQSVFTCAETRESPNSLSRHFSGECRGLQCRGTH